MKCYYPIDSARNRIGFKTPEACVYDASGTSLTTKLAQINSKINDRFDKNTIKKGLKYFANGKWADYGVVPSGYTEIGSNNTGVTDTTLSVWRWGAICIINFYGTIKYAADTRYKLYTLPNNLWAAGLTPCLGSDGSSKASMMALGSDIAFDFMTTISNYTMRSALTAIITSDPTDY